MVAQVYKFIHLQELDIQKPGEFQLVAAQVLILLKTECFITVPVRINQQVVYHLIQHFTHKIRQLDKEIS